MMCHIDVMIEGKLVFCRRGEWDGNMSHQVINMKMTHSHCLRGTLDRNI